MEKDKGKKAEAQVIGFDVSISGRDDGTIEAVYFTFLPDDVYRTEEILEDQLFVDYSSKGAIIGIEILSPVKISEILKFVDEERQPSFERFARNSVPGNFVYT